jgi:hypothetical protein
MTLMSDQFLMWNCSYDFYFCFGWSPRLWRIKNGDEYLKFFVNKFNQMNIANFNRLHHLWDLNLNRGHIWYLVHFSFSLNVATNPPRVFLGFFLVCSSLYCYKTPQGFFNSFFPLFCYYRPPRIFFGSFLFSLCCYRPIDPPLVHFVLFLLLQT